MTLETYINERTCSARESALLKIAAQQFELIGRLVERRLEAGFTLTELGRRSGLDRAEIAEIEGGRRSPSSETLDRLSLTLDLDLGST